VDKFENKIAILTQNAKAKEKENIKLKNKLKQLNSFDVDELFHTQHDEVFRNIDCMQCANCCKTTSPLLLDEDIKRISKHLKLSPKEFYTLYVKRDEDGDLVFKNVPCVFLDNKNSCKIYNHRPKACKEYPHTNRKKMVQILDLTMENYKICPAVYTIVEQIKESI
jgi:Fe-S-cluster containining protein